MHFVECRRRKMTDEPRNMAEEGVVLRVRKIGNSTGVILPRHLLTRLQLKAGDALHVVEASERGIMLSPYNPKHAKAMEIARQVFADYTDTFKALAK
jgi:putative addiction module antidote